MVARLGSASHSALGHAPLAQRGSVEVRDHVLNTWTVGNHPKTRTRTGACFRQCPLDVGLFHLFGLAGGEGGIRTLGTLARTPVFETGLFSHSSTSPEARLMTSAEPACKSGASVFVAFAQSALPWATALTLFGDGSTWRRGRSQCRRLAAKRKRLWGRRT